MSGYPLPGLVDDDSLDTAILEAHEACEELEQSRASFPAIVKYILGMRCDAVVKIEKIQQAMDAYDEVRDWLGDRR